MIKREETLPAIEMAGVWLISSDALLTARIQATLEPLEELVFVLDPDVVRSKEFALKRPGRLGLVILDVENDFESALAVIRKLRKSRVPAPMIVLTEKFSRDFGAKIISQGVPHCFSHDYCEEEFLAVARSLIKRASG